MLEYCKTILEKVSFDKHLFEKELGKSIRVLLKDEAIELLYWCKLKFDQYRNIIARYFKKLAF